MQILRKVIPLLLALLLPSLAIAAGSSITWTYEVVWESHETVQRVYTASLVSDDTTGAVSDTVVIHGTLLRMITNPGATAPTDNYDCVLNDVDGFDMVGGALANRDTATTEQEFPLVGAVVTYIRLDGTYTLSCSAMGNSKVTVIKFFLQD